MLPTSLALAVLSVDASWALLIALVDIGPVGMSAIKTIICAHSSMMLLRRAIMVTGLAVMNSGLAGLPVSRLALLGAGLGGWFTLSGGSLPGLLGVSMPALRLAVVAAGLSLLRVRHIGQRCQRSG